MTPPRMNRPSHRPATRDNPMTIDSATKELMECVACDCPNAHKNFKISLKQSIKIALLLDMEFHSGGVAPSKNECEYMVFGKEYKDDPVPGQVTSRVPDELAKKFPELVRVLNENLG